MPRITLNAQRKRSEPYIDRMKFPLMDVAFPAVVEGAVTVRVDVVDWLLRDICAGERAQVGKGAGPATVQAN